MFINNKLRAAKAYKAVSEKEQQTVGKATYVAQPNAKGVRNQQLAVFLKTKFIKLNFELHVRICRFLAYNPDLNTKYMA